MSTPSLQDLVNAIHYTYDTVGQTTAPLNCNSYDCKAFEAFRQICGANQYTTSRLYSYNEALKLLQKFNSTFLPPNYFDGNDIRQFLNKAQYSQNDSIPYDDLCCIVKRILVSLSQKIMQKQSNSNPVLRDNVNEASDVMNDVTCHGYDLNTDYFAEQDL
ncbi:hypothetical protein TTHERM_00283760 (macronuclear) [Tetrahymena thermophila SB210]|uniref:Uncharacterized protein n=1 Tax=Tetrahymena thermophila (strain SB210) TaxID=312017 RepID=I7MKB0_TETTS|nr:hypothetical protein TTHERM_00283760 [Tetrahymena thermophila SB210]EAR97987.1 hypothetical protein TTHERM_00283760 [Tetrahymena thermophila SB210]|eukprot:XP_001018232.1 hypothetical protein TTHERM_00283760 [Tetrahymena thermophila SB210]